MRSDLRGTYSLEGLVACGSLVSAMLLGGCINSPLVPSRSITYEVSFNADGKVYQVNKQFQCHYEDVSLFSQRGSLWHIREGIQASVIIGQLTGGEPFQIHVQSVPTASRGFNNSRCVSETTDVRSMVFLEDPLDGGQLISFDHQRTTAPKHQLKILSSRLVLRGAGLGILKEPSYKPPPEPRRMFYRLAVTRYPHGDWAKLSRLKDVVEQKRVPWLERGNAYPFTGWGGDDVAIARAYGTFLNGFPGTRETSPLIPNAAGDEWREPSAEDSAWHWRDEASAAPRVWTAYKGSRIEVPISSYYRLLYDPESGDLVRLQRVQFALR